MRVTKENAAQVVPRHPEGQRCLPAGNRTAVTYGKFFSS